MRRKILELEQVEARASQIMAAQFQQNFGLIARLARQHRLSVSLEDDLHRINQNGGTALQIEARVAQIEGERAATRKPPQPDDSGPASYSREGIVDVPWNEASEEHDYSWRDNSEVPLPPVR
jgi:hypothetical protein